MAAEMKIAGASVPVVPILLSEILIDSSYQRDQDEKHVQEIFNFYDDRAFQILEVSVRADGTKYVFDGGHRKVAAERKGFTHAMCRLHHGLTVEFEATYFNMLQNGRKRITPLQMFRADLARKYEPALRIEKMTRAAGLVIGESKNGGHLPHVAPLYAIDKIGVLSETLAAVEAAWDVSSWEPSHSRIRAQTFLGVGIFIANAKHKKLVLESDLLSQALDTNPHTIWASRSFHIGQPQATEYKVAHGISERYAAAVVARDKKNADFEWAERTARERTESDNKVIQLILSYAQTRPASYSELQGYVSHRMNETNPYYYWQGKFDKTLTDLFKNKQIVFTPQPQGDTVDLKTVMIQTVGFLGAVVGQQEQAA